MSNNCPILFFSDAHFGAHSAAQEKLKAERFAGLLRHADQIGAEVFFLGDLFDFWFEYRHWIPKVPLEVLAAIREFTRNGGTFHLILGNHDTWAGDYFREDLGVEIHRDDVSVTRHGLRILISHGDGKAESDSGYRLLKRVLRFRPNIALFRLLPADWAFRLARFCSGQSRELKAVIMGHLHEGWVRRRENGWWVNSGEFFETFTYVLLDVEGFHLKRYEEEFGG
jgi:UDP-2,3-diacylglucosamine hydrolase